MTPTVQVKIELEARLENYTVNLLSWWAIEGAHENVVMRTSAGVNCTCLATRIDQYLTISHHALYNSNVPSDFDFIIHHRFHLFKNEY